MISEKSSLFRKTKKDEMMGMTKVFNAIISHGGFQVVKDSLVVVL